MMKSMSVCLSVTFLLILPSPCQADDMYIMVKCLSVCRSGTCSHHQPALSPLSEREQRFIILFFLNHYTFNIKMMMRIVKIIMID